MNPKVSVIIPNYNYGTYLQDTVESVLKQDYSNIEIVVVDNGSTDDSLAVLASFQNSIIILKQDNLGQAVARNNGVAISTGEYIALLDADDYWEPSKISKQIEKLSEKVQFVYCGVRTFDSESKVTQFLLRPRFKNKCSSHFIMSPSTSIVPAGESSALFSRALFNKVNGFNPQLTSASGRDFFRKCSKFSEFDYVEDYLVNYRIHSSNMSKNVANLIRDTELSYKILFDDDNWKEFSSQKSYCFTKLYWSFLKNCVIRRDILGVFAFSLKIVQVGIPQLFPRQTNNRGAD